MKNRPDRIDLCDLNYEEAEKLLELIKGHEKEFRYLASDLKDGMKPFYTYEVKCTECPRTFITQSKRPIPKARLEEGGVCSRCEDDFK